MAAFAQVTTLGSPRREGSLDRVTGAVPPAKRGDTHRVSISAVVEDILGNKHGRSTTLAINDLVKRARVASMPMLGWIDPYGDTIFNVVQMQLVIPELKSLAEADHGSIGQAAAELLELARLVPLRPHRYLKFLGD